MIPKTLDEYSIKDLLINTNSLDSALYDHLTTRNEHELLISILNHHDLCRNINDELFAVQKSAGEQAIKLFYHLMPAQDKYVFCMYTNICMPLSNNRVIQNIWLFPNKKVYQKMKKEMMAEADESSYTHIMHFPANPNFNKLEDIFRDKYFDSDRLRYLNDYLEAHQDDRRKYDLQMLKDRLNVQQISPQEIVKVSKLPNHNDLVQKMLIYRQDWKKYRQAYLATDLEHDTKKVRQLKDCARALNARNYELHRYYLLLK